MNPLNLAGIEEALRTRFLKFKHVVSVHKVLKRLVEAEYRAAEPELTCIVGETGTGKTWIVRRFAFDYQRVETETGTLIPVLIANVPPKCSVKVLASTLLREMGSPLWNVGREEQLTFQLRTLLKKCGVRLIILNEANHLVDRGKERTHYLVGDWIKQTSELTGIPVVLVGIPRVLTLLKVNEQLADRVSRIITVEPFGVDERCSNRMEHALQAFDSLLTGIDRIPLADKTNARLMAMATAGRLRRIRRLLVEAVRLAAEQPKPRIDLDVLSQVFREHVYPGAPDTRNPFVPGKFNGLPLTGVNEPYAPRAATREEVDA